MKHIGLFEGIGGFSLAAEWMGWETIACCEINGFCQKILKQDFPKVIGHGDIKTTDFSIYRGQCDIVTGGFPCQPFSTAGKRKGTEDNRYLWPEMLRAIREISPRWIVGENVRGLTNWNGGMVFDQVQADLEAEGYEVLPFLLPACAVNAPHRRDRIWLVAYSARGNAFRGAGTGNEGEQVGEEIRRGFRDEFSCNGDNGIVTNTNSYGHESGRFGKSGPAKGESESQQNKREWIRGDIGGIGESGATTNAQCIGLSQRNAQQNRRRSQSAIERQNGLKSWEDFPTQSPIRGRDDGIPNRLERIKALGNAVVPQLVFQIFKAIEQYENL